MGSVGSGSRYERARALVGGILSAKPHVGPPAPVWVQAALILLASVLFGGQFVAFKKSFEAIGPSTLLALRPLLALPLMLLLMRWAREPIAVERASLRRVLVPATLLTVSFVTFMFAVHRLPVGITSTFVSTTPIFSVGFGLALGMQRVGAVAVGGSLVGVLGVAIATGVTSGHADALGLVLLALTNTSYALSLIAYRKMEIRISSAVYLIVMMAECAVLFVPLAIVLDGFSMHWGWGSGLGFAYIVTFGQIVAYVTVVALVRVAGAFQSSLTTPLVPVFAILFAFLVLDDPLLGRELAGGALIVLGVVAAILPARRPAGL